MLFLFEIILIKYFNQKQVRKKKYISNTLVTTLSILTIDCTGELYTGQIQFLG